MALISKSASIFFIFTCLLITTHVYADCRGCCNGHGGTVCINGVTKCADGTELSDKCSDNGCDVCDAQESTNNPKTTIKIASFNIQIFGKNKASEPEVIKTLAKIVSRFDVVAIQEIREKTNTAVTALDSALEALGEKYDYVIGPRLGRSNTKEQYAFFYRASVLRIGETYTYKELGADYIHREPLVSQFFSKRSTFDFVLINAHIDPDDVDREISVYPEIVADAQKRLGDEDIMIMGDFNADCGYFDEDKQIKLRDKRKFKWLIANQLDSTVAKDSCAYDRMIVTRSMAKQFTGKAGVFPFDIVYDLDVEPKEISDHYPVYAVFSYNVTDKLSKNSFVVY